MKTDIAGLLLASSRELQPASDDVESWWYGWALRDYRRSPDARLGPPNKTARMSDTGVGHYEVAVEALLSEQETRRRYDPEEFWGLVASLVYFLWSEQADAEETVRQLQRLRRPRPSLVLFLAANVDWEGDAVRLGSAVIGDLDSGDFLDSIRDLFTNQDDSGLGEYLEKQKHRRPAVGFACLVPSQLGQAFHDGGLLFEQICDMCLLLEPDKSAQGLRMLSGSWNRPGVRGVILDRHAIETALSGSGDEAELASGVFISGEIGDTSSVQWHSPLPVPLGKMLQQLDLVNAIECVIAEEDPISARIRVAARWFAEAFWTSTNDDAALALGVAMDTLIGSKNGLPGRLMRDRFALLEPDPNLRPARAARYDELYGVRSAVAHGGKSRRLSDPDFLELFGVDVTWAARRLLSIRDDFGREVASDLDGFFDKVRWGLIQWPRAEGNRGHAMGTRTDV